jgi:hypothetical protein
MVFGNRQVDVNRDLARQCRLELQKVCKTLPGSTHALLFAGTKLLSVFSKPDIAELHVQDLFSLLLYARSIFHPIERELDTDEPPVADYSDHAQFANDLPKEELPKEANDLPKDDAQQNVSYSETTDVSEITLEEDEGPNVANGLPNIATIGEWLDLSSKAAPLANVSRQPFDWLEKDRSASAADLSFQLSRGAAPSDLSFEAIAILQLALWRAALFDESIDGLSSPQLLQSVISLQESGGIVPANGLLDRATFARLTSRLNARSGPAGTMTEKNNLASGEKNNSSARAAPVTAALFLRIRKAGKIIAGAEEAHSECRVHFAELENGLILVLVCGARPDGEESARLQRIEGYLRSRRSLGSYLSFFVAKGERERREENYYYERRRRD